MVLLTKKQQDSHENAKACYIYQEKFENKYLKDKKDRKFRSHSHYTGEYGGATYNICNLKYSIANNIPIVFLMILRLSSYHERVIRRT